MAWNQSVQFYLEIVDVNNGIPDHIRPQKCVNCGQEHRLIYHHGKYQRWVITLEASYEIPIYMFYCPVPNCNRAFALIPDFVEKHHQVAIDIKQRIIEQNEEGSSLADIAVESETLPGGPYSEKTLWRWEKRWDDRLVHGQPMIWTWLLRRLPHFHLLKGQARPHTDWQWFLGLWKQVQSHLLDTSHLRFLHFLHRLSRSLTVSFMVENPKIDVHRSINRFG